MDKTNKIINLYSKLVLYNNELHNVYGNSIFSIDGISFYKPRCVAFTDRYLWVNYFITLRRCNKCHTIMKYINRISLSDEVHLLSDDYYPQIGINEVRDCFKYVAFTQTYKSGIVDEPAILFTGSYDIASIYYCTTNNNYIKCGTLNIDLSNNIFGDVQNESGCSCVFLYEPVLDRFCAVNETPLGVYQLDGLPNITGQVYTQNIAVGSIIVNSTSLDDTYLDVTSVDEDLMSTISIESFI